MATTFFKILQNSSIKSPTEKKKKKNLWKKKGLEQAWHDMKTFIFSWIIPSTSGSLKMA